MRLLRHPDAADFLEHAEAWLLRREAEHNLILGLAYRLAENPSGYESPLYFATVQQDGQVAGCAFRTPPFKLGLTRMPAAAAPLLAEDVADVYASLPSVLGPEDMARPFAKHWSRQTGTVLQEGMRQRIYRLDAVIPPARPAPGRLRPAGPGDAARMTAWVRGFFDDTGVEGPDPARFVAERLRDASLYLWEDDGAPVSMAGAMGRTPHGIRVGYVYTPPERRGRGYASTCVAAVSRHLLAHGCAFCVLYTDLANPTSNHIYEQIGYRPVCDVMDFHFDEAA